MPRISDELKKRKILTASFKLFREKGFKETSIKDISDVINIATGSIYTYFPNKKSLLNETLNELIWNRIFKKIEDTSSKIKDKLNNNDKEILATDSIVYILKILKKSHVFIHSIYQDPERIALVNRNLEKLSILIYPVLKYNKDDKYQQDILKINLFMSGALFLVSIKSKSELDTLLLDIQKVFVNLLK